MVVVEQVVEAPVTVVPPVGKPPGPGESVPATTTLQQDLVVAGQRHINILWERTQQMIAVSVTFTVLIVCVYLIVRGEQNLKLVAFGFLSNVSLVVIQNYFQRTNHEKTGGVIAGYTGR